MLMIILVRAGSGFLSGGPEQPLAIQEVWPETGTPIATSTYRLGRAAFQTTCRSWVGQGQEWP